MRRLNRPLRTLSIWTIYCNDIFTLEAARKIIRRVTATLGQGNFPLTKWATSWKEILEDIDKPRHVDTYVDIQKAESDLKILLWIKHKDETVHDANSDEGIKYYCFLVMKLRMDILRFSIVMLGFQIRHKFSSRKYFLPWSISINSAYRDGAGIARRRTTPN